MATKRALQNRKKEIADRISALLTKKEWTQKQLAKSADLKDSYVSKVLNADANMTLSTIILLEHALGERIIEIPKR